MKQQRLLKDESDAIFSVPDRAEADSWDALLWQNWQSFMLGEQPSTLRPSILQSWQRS